MDDVYENIDDYNPNRQRKILTVFDDTIADIMSNKKFQAIIKELFIRCRKLNISLDFITQSFFCSIQHIWLWKIRKKIYREIQNIAMNHSPDIDYKDFVKIYRECTKKTFFFDNWYYVTSKWSSKISKKIWFLLIKITVTDQLEIIDKKIKANQAQYDLDRLATKISAYSSGDLRKYEYLNGEDLGYKPSVVEQVKFDYSPLASIFTKGLDKDDKKKGLFKTLENIKGKNEELLKAFITANRVCKTAKNERDFNYDSWYTFYRF